MASRRLSESESKEANALLNNIRARLRVLSGREPKLHFAYRRRIYIRLMNDERGTPAFRKKLKAQKLLEQQGKCALCHKELPKSESELDRFIAHAGYTPKNTQLIHHHCHRKQQAVRRYR